MKLFSSLAAVAVLSFAASAAPSPGGWQPWNQGCPSRAYVENLISQEIVYLKHTDAAAARAAGEAIFDPAIEEYGDSINSLRRAPISQRYPLNSSHPQIDSLNLVVDCATFVWQWRFYGIGSGPNPYIQGFTLGKVNSAGLIYYQYVEFGSLAWAENSGYAVTPPTTGPFAAPPSK